MDARIVSNQVINSLQISVLKEVPSGNFNPGVNFLLKNISDDDVEVTIIPAGQKGYHKDYSRCWMESRDM